ncbi:MAG: hypothetical protein A7315_04320 [Candidatus Altiarchaeales archaeon WOR_SM1_79]|nr:MAG: hypothetical protein A7315_04320 [Candidatus Altiarchaeales archaeon WOR_SM1_79]
MFYLGLTPAVDALNNGSYDISKQYAQEAISLAENANCGETRVRDLRALAVKYDGRTIGVSGKVRDIDTAYGHGDKFVVDDGTGLITVEYEGSMRDIDEGDDVLVEGVFSRSNDAIEAEKVEKTGLYGGSGILLIIIGLIAIATVILYSNAVRKG